MIDLTSNGSAVAGAHDAKLLDAVPVAMAVIRAEGGVFEYVNPAYERAVGRSAAELVGRPIVDAIPALALAAADGDCDRAGLHGFRIDGSAYGRDEYPLMRTLATGETVHGEQIVVQRAGNAARTIEVSSAPVLDDAGTMVRAVVVLDDVTQRLAVQSQIAERRASARAQVRVEQVLQAAGDGIWVLDGDGCTTMINSAAQELTGYDFADLVGRPAHDFIHHSYADGTPYPVEVCPIQASVRDGIECQVEDEVFWRKDGTCFPVSYRTTPIYQDGVQIGAVQVFRDLTAERESQAERRRLREAAASQAQALQLNDDVLQGLTATKLAMDLGEGTQAREFLDHTITGMRAIIVELLERDGVQVEPGALTRTRAADLAAIDRA